MEIKDAANILAVRLDNMGDVIMTQPALRALKNQTPNRRLTLLTSSAGAAVAKFIPEIDDCIIFDVPWVKNDLLTESPAIFKLIQELSERKFGAAVIFTNFSQSSLPAAMICKLAGIPEVAGYCRENPYELINHWLPDHEPFISPIHGVIRQLNLVKSLGAHTSNINLHLKISLNASRALEKIKSLNLNLNYPWLILHPGASEEKRIYPLEYFAKAVQRLRNNFNFQVLISGSLREYNICQRAAELIGRGSFNAAGLLNLEELIFAISQTEIILTNNTGPAHIAAATKTPAVVMYARTNPEHTPWSHLSRVLYFDVPLRQRSKNPLLKFITSWRVNRLPQPSDIVDAAQSILRPKIT